MQPASPPSGTGTPDGPATTITTTTATTTAPITTTTTRVDEPTADAGDRLPTPIRRWLDARVVAAGIVVAAVRFWFAVDRRMFHVVADEPGQLAMARWLSGGTRWNMFDHSTWRPGYSLLLAPMYRLVDTGEGAVRAALTLNAVLAGVSAMILTRLLWRWTTSWTRASGSPAYRANGEAGAEDCASAPRVIGPWWCAGIATVVAVAPAAIASSAYAWAEATVTATFLATVWWTQRVIDSGRTGDAIVATFAATLAITTHGRSLALLPTVVAFCAVVLVVHRRRLGAIAVIGYGVALGALSLAFTRWVHDAVWEDPSEVNGAGSIIERLDAPTALLDSLVGQTWYQLVASLGMVGVGAGMLLTSLVRPSGRLDRRTASMLVVLTAPLVLTSVTFMADRDRADQLVYGRYVDAVVWPLAALGLALVVRLVRDLAPGVHVARRGEPGELLVAGVAVLCALSGLLVAWQHGDQLAGDVGLRMMVPGLLPYIGSEDGVPVLAITLVATAVLMAIGGAIRAGRPLGTWGGAVVVVTFGVLLAWAGVRVHDAQAVSLNTWAIGEDVAAMDAIVPDGEAIGVMIVPDSEHPRVPWSQQRQRYQIYQLYLPEREFVWERTPNRPTRRFVVAPAGYAPLTDAGATIRWGDPAVRVALWELPADDGRIEP